MSSLITSNGNELIFNLETLNGHDFEAAMVAVFQRMGYRTERGKLSNDEGKDIVLRRSGETIIVECKHQKAVVGRPVIQKLHSAVDTTPGVSKGIVVTTSAFSPAAQEYVTEKVNAAGIVEISLWDSERLISEARAVGIFFVARGQDRFYTVPWREKTEVDSDFYDHHLATLQSRPRAMDDVVRRKKTSMEVVPGLFIEYEADKLFETQAGIIYHAKEIGCRVHRIAGVEINSEEQSFWSTARLIPLVKTEINGKAVPQYFGEPTVHLIDGIKSDVARNLSRSVSYSGRNNQRYRKFCEVKPSDVHTQVKQVLFARWTTKFKIGPRKYAVWLADDISAQPHVTYGEGFSDGLNAFREGTGILCNDCGLICPTRGERAGSSCDDCGRTLCHSHAWKWSPELRASRTLCSSCYEVKDARAEYLEPNPALGKFWLALLTGFIPGVTFLAAKRFAVSAACCALVVALAFFKLFEILSVTVAVSILHSVYWLGRIRLHQRNMKALAIYEPEWKE